MSVAVEERPVAGGSGIRLHARRGGKGETVLLVHGSVSDVRTWDGTLKAVAERFHAVAYSRRGHHPNPPLEKYRFQDQIDDVLAVIDGLEGEVALVGHSSGGVLALIATMRRPDAVRLLVAIEPPCFTMFVTDPPRPPEIGGLLLRDPAMAVALIRFGMTALEPARRAIRRGDRAEAIRLFGTGVLGKGAFARLSDARMDQVERNFFPTELDPPAFPPLSREDLGRIGCPALVVAGTESPAFFRVLAARLAGVLPQGRLAVVEGASHNLHEEAPAAFRRELMAFLGERA